MRFRHYLKRLRQAMSGTTNKQRTKKSRASLKIEALEDRQLLAASVLVQNGVAFLDIQGSAGADTLELSVDPTNTNRFQVTTTIGGVTSTQTFDRTVVVNGQTKSVDLVKMNGLGGTDTLNVKKVLSGVRVQATTDAADTLNVGDAGKLNDIKGDVEFAGSGDININDAKSGLARTVSVTSTQVQLSGVDGRVKFGGSDLDRLTITTGGQADVVNVTSTRSGATTVVRTNGGADQINVLGTTGELSVEAGAGNDVITIGSASDSLDDIKGKVTFRGQADSDSLQVNDQATPLSFVQGTSTFATTRTDVTISDESISRTRTGQTASAAGIGITTSAPAVIDYDTVETLDVTASNVANFIDVESLSAGQTTIIGGTAKDVISLSPTDKNLDALSGNALLSHSLAVNAGAGADELILNDQNAPASLSLSGIGVSITDQSVTRTRQIGTNLFITLTASITYDSVAKLEVNASNTVNNVAILSTKAGTTTTVDGGTATDTFRLGKADKGLDDLKGAVVINGGANGSAGDKLILDDLKSAASQTYTITDTEVSRAGFDLTYGTVEATTLLASEKGAVVNVEETKADTATTAQLAGAAGINNTVNVAPTGKSLDLIDGRLDVKGSATGTDKLFVFDQNQAAPVIGTHIKTTDTLTDSSLTSEIRTRVGFFREIEATRATINFDSALDEMVFNASNLVGQQPHEILVQSTAVKTTVNAGTGGDNITVGRAGDGMAGIQGELIIAAGAGSDQLSFDDKAANVAQTFTLKATSLERSGAAKVSFSGVQDLVIDAGTKNDTLTVVSIPSADVTFKGNVGFDTLNAPDTNNVFRITDLNKGDLNNGAILFEADILNGGSQADRFIFEDGKVLFGLIDGKGGLDTLDLSDYTTAVTMNLTTGQASVAAGIAGIENALGGSKNDTLIGNAGANILVGNGGGDTIEGRGGRDLMIGGTGQDSLTAGGDGIVNDLDEAILIGGTTDFDVNLAALQAVLAEWTSARSFDARVANLVGLGSGPDFANRLNGNVFLSFSGANPTVNADGAIDLLSRNEDRTLYFKDAVDNLFPSPRGEDVVFNV